MAIADIDQSAAGRASGVARRKKAAERALVADRTWQIVDRFNREDIGPKLLQVALNVIEAATAVQITPQTALEVKQLVEAANVVHKMARLELGESTSNTATFDITDRDAQVQALKSRVAELDAEQ